MAAKKKRVKKTLSKKKKIVKKHSILAANPIMHVRVTRFNPEMDFYPRTHEYALHSHAGESVLDLLTRIKHTQDGSLTFRGSCGYGGCGSCGVKVNGKPVLGCVTQVADAVDPHARTLTIEPMDVERVIKDLVVDETAFFSELLRIKPWLVPRKQDERRNHKMGVNDVKKLARTQECILCGLCNANVSTTHDHAKNANEIGPAAWVKAYRYLNDLRDGDPRRAAEYARMLPVHYSLEKANWCPRNISPGDRIREMSALQKEKNPPKRRKM